MIVRIEIKTNRPVKHELAPLEAILEDAGWCLSYEIDRDARGDGVRAAAADESFAASLRAYTAQRNAGLLTEGMGE